MSINSRESEKRDILINISKAIHLWPSCDTDVNTTDKGRCTLQVHSIQPLSATKDIKRNKCYIGLHDDLKGKPVRPHCPF